MLIFVICQAIKDWSFIWKEQRTQTCGVLRGCNVAVVVSNTVVSAVSGVSAVSAVSGVISTITCSVTHSAARNHTFKF